MAGSQNIINALKQYTGASHNEATIAANREVSAFDPERSLFVQGSGRRAAASPTVHYQRSREIRGEMESTGRVGDLAIDRGQGFFVVKTRTGAVALSNMGSFRVSEVEQKIMGPSGEVLMGWELNAKGERPQNSSSLDSLVELSTKQLTAKAVATDFVSMSANLSLSQKAKEGPGSLMSLTVHNVDTAADLIAPGENATGSFFIGDQLQLTPQSAGGLATNFEYGGMSISRSPGVAAIYGASSVDEEFNVTNSGTPSPDENTVTFGAGFRVRVGVGGNPMTFTATSAANEAALGNFNSLRTLADAINNSADSAGRLRATISDGRLLLAATNADTSITIEDFNTPVGQRGVSEILGLVNVSAAPNGVHRYASLEELRNKLVATKGLTGEIVDGKKLRFGSNVATSTLEVKGESNRPRNYRRVSVTTGTDTARRSQVTIESPSHGLVDGDYVTIAGGLQVTINGGPAQNPLPNGTYRARVIDGDRFALVGIAFLDSGRVAPDVVPRPGDIMVVAPAIDQSTLTWRKVAGNAEPLVLAPSVQNTAVSALNAGGVGADYVQVTLDLNAAPDAINQLGIGDMVFVENSNVLVDGYYRVVGAAGNNVIVAARAQDGGGANISIDLKNPAHIGNAAVGEVGYTVRKASARNAEPLDSFPIRLAANSRTVTIHNPSAHTYSVNDIVMFTDLAAPIVRVGTATIRQDTAYTITAVNPAANTYTIELLAADGADANGANAAIGYTKFDDGTGAGLGANIAAGAVNNGIATMLGPNAQIQNLSKSFRGRGVNVDAEYFSRPLPTTYDGGSTTKSMAAETLAVQPHATHTARVRDAFGKAHNVNVSYIRLTENEWAVEIWVPKNPDSSYDVSTGNKVAYGNIEFNGNGQIFKIDDSLSKPIKFNWSNGSESTSVTFDFGKEAAKTGITQLEGPYDLRFLDPNGSESGALETIEYQEDGTVVARFTNGSSRAFAQLPVAVVPDANSLIAIGGGHYVEALNKSGAIVLKVAGVGGAGTFLPGFLEASKSDENEALLNMTELNHLRSIALKAVSKEEEVNKLAVQLL